jgi:hypothetical protein
MPGSSAGAPPAAGGRHLPAAIFTAAGLEVPPAAASPGGVEASGRSIAAAGAEAGTAAAATRPVQRMHTNLPDLRWHLNRQSIISRYEQAKSPRQSIVRCRRWRPCRLSVGLCCQIARHLSHHRSGDVSQVRRAWNDRDTVSRHIPKSWDDALAHPTLRSLTLRSSRRYVLGDVCSSPTMCMLRCMVTGPQCQKGHQFASAIVVLPTATAGDAAS